MLLGRVLLTAGTLIVVVPTSDAVGPPERVSVCGIVRTDLWVVHMFSDRGRSLLTVGGSCSALLAALHVVVIAVGAPGYRYVGAPDEFAMQAEAGSRAPAILTAMFAAIFAIWALYGFGGARRLRRPPLVRFGVVHAAGTRQAWRRLRHHDRP